MSHRPRLTGPIATSGARSAPARLRPLPDAAIPPALPSAAAAAAAGARTWVADDARLADGWYLHGSALLRVRRWGSPAAWR